MNRVRPPVLVRLLLVPAAAGVLTGFSVQERPVFDPAQNKPVVPGNAATTPGAGAGDSGITSRGADSSSCLNGWVTPGPGTPLRDEALRALAGTQAAPTPEAADVRVFVGSDRPGASPAQSNVTRWYLEVGAGPLAGRYLLERRGATVGVAAVAAAGTSGWSAPDWTAFRDPDGSPTAAPGLPGRWSGSPYDAVNGRLLPPSAVGCLDGT